MTAHPEAPPLTSFGPRVRKSPFFEATRRWGYKAYSIYNHTYMPLYYESPLADYWRLVQDVTLWDVACQRQVEIIGPDAARFTQWLTPRNLSTCKVGQCKYVLVTDETGGIINDPVLLKLAEDHFWLSLADSDILLWAKGAALNSGMDVTIREPDVSPLQVQGPKSALVMEALFGAWIQDLKYYWFRETELNGIPLVVSRTGWSSEKGYEIFLRDGRRGVELWEAVMAAGKPHAIAPAAPSSIRRIEGAMLSLGADMGLADNPFELGLERLVDLEMDADFIGKAALREIRAAGVKRRFAGLEVDGEPIAANEHPWPVTRGGERAGTLTSLAYSPRLEKTIALAILDISAAEMGTTLRVAAPFGERDARVVPVPFFDPKKQIASG